MIKQSTMIKVENLTKRYKLYSKPIDRLKEAINPFGKKYYSEFMALDDISFEIPRGQIVGIIGKNGSGKSTLLKILTGILSPSSGTVCVDGKIAALLELGAGFNPELSGYENIFLNGYLMGYSKQEMQNKLSSIIDFAEIGDFVSQPVKTYSSGMFVRLAFAVAVAVNPDILIVDEALSVGDIRFQQKCIRKFREFFELGKTVIFVGHDIEAINSFCSHCIWIHEGKIKSQGFPKTITDDYISFMSYGLLSKTDNLADSIGPGAAWILTESFRSFGESDASIVAIQVADEYGRALHTLLGGERVHIKIKVVALSQITSPIFGFNVKNRLGSNVFGGNTYLHRILVQSISPGTHYFGLEFDFPYLSNGEYPLTIAFADGNQFDHVQKSWIHDCFVFQVGNPDAKYSNGDGLVLNNGFSFESLNA